MKSVHIDCPARLNLFLNLTGYDKTNNTFNYVTCSQTIDIYNELLIEDVNKDIKGVNFNNKDNIPTEYLLLMYKAVEAFFQYTGLESKSININIINRIPLYDCFAGDISNAVGIIIALNNLYNTNLSKIDLKKIALNIGKEAPYFVSAGYSKLSTNNSHVEKLDEIYKTFLVIDPHIELDSQNQIDKMSKCTLTPIYRKGNIIYNDFNRLLPDKLKEIKNFLLQYKETEHSMQGTGPIYYIASKNGLFPSRIIQNLKKEFPDISIKRYIPTSGYRMYKKIT